MLCVGVRKASLVPLVVKPPRAASETYKTAGQWEEAWTFRGCGHDVDVPITFTPDGKCGTHYAIKGVK